MSRKPKQPKAGYIRKISAYPGLASSKVGAIGELRTSVDLLAKGYEVFISLSPDGSCDLIALKNGKCLRIEVRTSHYASDGQVYLHVSPRDKGRQDHYAAVLPDKILYFPDLSSCI